MRGSSGIIAAVVVAAVLGVVAATATAGDHHGGPPPGGGHTPVTICHKPGTPAQKTLTFDDDGWKAHIGHGDTPGPCVETPPPYDECDNLEGNQPEGTDCYPDEPVDYCDTLPGIQAEDEDCPAPPVDVCENLPGNQPEGTDCNPTTPPTAPPPGHDCVFVGADKDGGHDAYGGTNDDCAPAPTPPVTVTSTPPTTAPPAVVVPPTVTPPAAKPPVVKPPKAKPAKKPTKPKPVAKPKPKPDSPPVVKKVGHVCKTLADGTPRRWYGGGNGTKPGCYAIVRGSG